MGCRPVDQSGLRFQRYPPDPARHGRSRLGTSDQHFVGERREGQFGQANYSAAKAGILGFTKAIAQEVAKKGVTVNAIAPGYIGTDMVMAIKQEVRDAIVATVPMGRLGKPEEIGALCAYLASDMAGYMTGATLNINGGLHMS